LKLFLAVVLVVCLPIVVFALSNTTVVALGFWPTDYVWEVPVSIAILIAMAIAFLLGALVVWVAELGQRRRARHAERTVRLLEAQVEDLKARVARPIALPPPP
jgi:putative membrane protein